MAGLCNCTVQRLGRAEGEINRWTRLPDPRWASPECFSTAAFQSTIGGAVRRRTTAARTDGCNGCSNRQPIIQFDVHATFAARASSPGSRSQSLSPGLAMCGQAALKPLRERFSTVISIDFAAGCLNLALSDCVSMRGSLRASITPRSAPSGLLLTALTRCYHGCIHRSRSGSATHCPRRPRQAPPAPEPLPRSPGAA